MIAPPNEILIVDDEVGIRDLLSEILQDEGYQVSVAENAGQARTYRARAQPSLVLLDIWMPDTDGVTLLREWAANGQLTMPVVIMSGHGTIETAVEATRIGAFDFLEKPVGLQKLLSTVTRALKAAAGQAPRHISLTALGTSAPVIEVERAIEQLLRANRPILVVGEPGTGHELVARAVHAPETPYVVLATGARLATNPLLLLEEARDGTLYCSEIGNYTKAEQKGLAFLLPKLEKHNTVLVCTSSEQLGNLAAEGKFDAGLLASLSVGAVMLPPLRQRREDLPALIDRLWRDITASQRTLGKIAVGGGGGAFRGLLARKSRPSPQRDGQSRAHGRQRDHAPSTCAAFSARLRCRRHWRSRPSLRRGFSSCRFARRARPSRESISSTSSARSKAT